MFSEHVQLPPSSLPRAELRERTRTRVLATAERMFAAHGFGETTIRKIAAEAGVSVGSVMGVGDKDALLVEIFERRIAELHDRPAAAAPASAPSDRRPTRLPARLVELVHPFIVLFAERQELSRRYAAILVSGAHRSRVFTELADRLEGEFREALAAYGSGSDSDSGSGTGLSHALYLSYLGLLFSAAGRDTIDPGALASELETAFGAICEEATR